MFNSRSFILALVALLSFVTFSSAQQITAYQGPAGPAYGYALDANGNPYFTSAPAFGVSLQNGSNVYIGDTFVFSVDNLGTSIVYAAEGLSAAAVPLPYGQYGLVGSTVQTVAMSLGLSGQYEASFVIPNNPSLIGVHLFFQGASLFTSNPNNSYVVTDGITFTIQ